MDTTRLQEAIRAARESKGLSQRQAAALAGVTQTQQRRAETDVARVSLHYVEDICSPLGIHFKIDGHYDHAGMMNAIRRKRESRDLGMLELGRILKDDDNGMVNVWSIETDIAKRTLRVLILVTDYLGLDFSFSH